MGEQRGRQNPRKRGEQRRKEKEEGPEAQRSGRERGYSEGGCHALSSLLTVYVLLGDLPKDLQVGPVEDPAQDIREVTVLGPKEPLRGHPVGNQPHAKEEEEEEHILHLQKRKMRPIRALPFPTLAPPLHPKPRLLP